jgi:hypothetical protein
MFLPVKKDITIFKGIQFRMVFRASTKNCAARDNTKVPVDLTNYDAYMQIRKKTCGCDKELLFDLNTPVSYISVTDPANGEVTINIPPSVTGDLSFTCGEYWIVMHSKKADENFLLMYGEVSTTCPVTIVPDFVVPDPDPDPEPEPIDVFLLSIVDNDGYYNRELFQQDNQTSLGFLCDRSVYIGGGAIIGTQVETTSGMAYHSISMIDSTTAIPSMIIDPLGKYGFAGYGRYVESTDGVTPSFWSIVLIDERVYSIDCRHVVVALIDGAFQVLQTQDFTIGDESAASTYLYFTGTMDISPDGQYLAIMYEVEEVSTGNLAVSSHVYDLTTYTGMEIGPYQLEMFTPGRILAAELFWLSKLSTTGEHILVVFSMDPTSYWANSDSFVFSAIGVSDSGLGYLDTTEYYQSLRYVGPFADIRRVTWQDGGMNKVAVYTQLESYTSNPLFVLDFENVEFDGDTRTISQNPRSTPTSLSTDGNPRVVPCWSVDKNSVIIADINKGIRVADLVGETETLYDQYPIVQNDSFCGIQALSITNLQPVTCLIPVVS